jgi:TM2 domain-containing membrane protein YozV
MNCANHPETAAVAYCRTCGKALCQACERTAQGTIFCEEHFPAANPAPGTTGTTGPAVGPTTTSTGPIPGATPYSPYTSPYAGGDASASPGLAFILGLIPGVGAIYNGQYAKGLVHVLVLGLLISIIANGAAGGMEALFGLMIALWFFYMAFEAYHTARKRQRGEPVDEFSSLVPLKSQASGFPIAPIILIGVGVVFLLNNLELVRLYQLLRYWPVALILLGVYLLYARLTPDRRGPSGPEPTATATATPQEASHER